MFPERGREATKSHLASLPGRYPLAVTRYRESELCSSSIYNQNDPWDPPVVFEEFLRNNENIEDEVQPRLLPAPAQTRDLCPGAACLVESKLSGH